MTRKHFEAMAAIVREHADTAPDVARDIAGAMAREFAAANPRFDRARFMRAAGVDA